jgi:hypothetical protein
MKKDWVLAVLAVAAIFALPRPGCAQGQDRYKARLTTVPMDGGMRATVAGSGSVAALLADKKLTITGTFTGLRSPATTARLYRGPIRGVRGVDIAGLTVSNSTNGTVTGSIDLTPEQARDLREGRLYIQIASEKAPDGNLWGWLLR